MFEPMAVAITLDWIQLLANILRTGMQARESAALQASAAFWLALALRRGR